MSPISYLEGFAAAAPPHPFPVLTDISAARLARVKPLSLCQSFPKHSWVRLSSIYNTSYLLAFLLPAVAKSTSCLPIASSHFAFVIFRIWMHVAGEYVNGDLPICDAQRHHSSPSNPFSPILSQSSKADVHLLSHALCFWLSPRCLSKGSASSWKWKALSPQG
jgi:hypothetical protein